MNLPDLGVGLVHLPGLGLLLDRLERSPEVVEIEPQAFWTHLEEETSFRTNLPAIEQAVGGRSALVHSVGLPIGGSSDGDQRQIAALRETLDFLKPPWWSDHASLVWADQERHNFGFLMPPLQCAESVGIIADRIKCLQDLFGLPFAFETGVSYLRPLAGEWPDGAFWGAIADRADCGILLDLHNLWTNAINGREPIAQALSELPPERIWEMHVAGGQMHRGMWLDAHSGLPPPGLLELAAATVETLPNLHAIIFEIVPDYIPAFGIEASEISDCLSKLGRIWERRAIGGRDAKPPETSGFTEPQFSLAEWEECLRLAVSCEKASGALADDPGIAVYRDLIGMVRRGMIVEALPLSLRFLLVTFGEAAVDELFERFWSRSSAQPFISEEARAFAEYALRDVDLPHLDEVLNFELLGHRATLTGEAEYLSMNCEPEALLRSLAEGAGTPCIRPCEARIEITPPEHSVASWQRATTRLARGRTKGRELGREGARFVGRPQT